MHGASQDEQAQGNRYLPSVQLHLLFSEISAHQILLSWHIALQAVALFGFCHEKPDEAVVTLSITICSGNLEFRYERARPSDYGHSDLNLGEVSGSWYVTSAFRSLDRTQRAFLTRQCRSCQRT